MDSQIQKKNKNSRFQDGFTNPKKKEKQEELKDARYCIHFDHSMAEDESRANTVAVPNTDAPLDPLVTSVLTLKKKCYLQSSHKISCGIHWYKDVAL